tara:strand:+ start:65 stop:340 length:276 start_codon:yes stop_codon:yes gene_type:complete
MEDFMEETPELLKPVEKENPMKEWLVDYVGNLFNPENDEVNVEMIIQAMAMEFPEFILAIAEENFIRGYQQALADVDNVPSAEAKEENANA